MFIVNAAISTPLPIARFAKPHKIVQPLLISQPTDGASVFFTDADLFNPPPQARQISPAAGKANLTCRRQGELRQG